MSRPYRFYDVDGSLVWRWDWLEGWGLDPNGRRWLMFTKRLEAILRPLDLTPRFVEEVSPRQVVLSLWIVRR